ncbi:hypothetical protein HDU83_002670 [Entophlyctis luteolus]|nr:hypothetical protein HDU83_002670 [Entophlyctis luteolus]
MAAESQAGQVRDEYRKDYDAGRGGWSPASETEYVTFEMQQEMRLVKQTETYNFAGAGVPTCARDDYYQAEQTQQSFPSYRSKRREREEEENSSKRREREDEDNDGEGYTDEFGRYRNTDEYIIIAHNLFAPPNTIQNGKANYCGRYAVDVESDRK